MPHQIMLDTCVWLDTAADIMGNEIISRIEALLSSPNVTLLVPKIVIEEFDKHKDESAKQLAKRIKVRVVETKRFLQEYSDAGDKDPAIPILENFLSRVDKLDEVAGKLVRRIESLFRLPQTKVLVASTDTLVRVTERGYRKQAPFHTRNGTADAVIIELYGECVRQNTASNCRFTFVTSNKNDFSNKQDHRLPHDDIKTLFDDGRSSYSLNIAEAVNRLCEELPSSVQGPSQKLSDQVVKHVEALVEQKPGVCPACRNGQLVGGGFRRTAHGLSWHLMCNKCFAAFDTGDLCD